MRRITRRSAREAEPRTILALVSVLVALACTSCLRTSYNRCTETPPERECELLDAGMDTGPDADVDASADAAPPDAPSPDADAPDVSLPDSGSDGG